MSSSFNNVYNDYLKRSNVIPDDYHIEVPENAKYLSDFLEDLPHDCFFNKVITGCGGTTLALTNKENYVVAVHSLNVVKNKSEQHSNILGVHGEMSNDAIIKYLFDYSDKPKKFIVTYDSLPRLIDVIENNSKCEVFDFRLLVDEIQVLIRNLGEFKPVVSAKLLDNTYKFKSVCYLTATPTNVRYLPEPIKKLEYIELKWPNVNKAVINHCRVGNQFQTKLTSFIVNKLDNTDDDIYVFYNSKAGVCKIISAISAIYGNKITNEIEIIFADNDSNLKYFKKNINKKLTNGVKLGYSLEVDSEGNPVDSNRKRIKFISSFGFEGVDFYSFGRGVTTIIAADAASKSMRYDISIDIPQILGRVRRDKTTGKFPKNDIYFIWKTMEDVVKFTTEEEVLKYIAKKKVLYEDVLIATNKNKDVLEDDDPLYKSMDPYVIYKEDSYEENNYVMEAIMSVFSVINAEYSVLYNTNGNGSIVTSLSNISDELDSFTIPQLSTKYSSKLDRKVCFTKAAFEYYELYNEIIKLSNLTNINTSEMREDLQIIRESHPLLNDALDYFDINDIISGGANITHIRNKIEKEIVLKDLYNNMHKFNINMSFMSDKDLKEKAKEIINLYDLSFKPNVAFFSNFFKLKRKTVNGVSGKQLLPLDN